VRRPMLSAVAVQRPVSRPACAPAAATWHQSVCGGYFEKLR